MPGGGTWRDAATHTDDDTDKSYVYVHAQAGGANNFWIIDLSYLSGTIPNLGFLPPIPASGIVSRSGYPDAGHTVNVAGGYLFINSAYNSQGVYILDLLQDPWDPPLVAHWTGGAGHDTFFFPNLAVPGMGNRDIMFASDGGAARTRLVDLTNVRSNYAERGTPLLIDRALSETNRIAPQYAHSTAIPDDGLTMYIFDERNNFDIGMYDISDPLNPVFQGDFQWSGEERSNAIVHNGRVRGDYLFVAYYEAGLRVFDITDRFNPVEVGHAASRPIIRSSFSGAWNVYVDLPSGNVLVSDMSLGTLIVRLRD